MKEAEKLIRETRDMIDPTHRNVTGQPASDDAVMLSLATQLYLARKKLTECKCPHCQTIYDHLYPAKL